MTTEHAPDSVAVVVTKVGPPISVSLATFAGYNVSDLILWATLIYTLMMIAHKGWQIWKEITGRKKNDTTTN